MPKKQHQPTPEWHHMDAKDHVLGRLATRVASLIMGKHRPDFTPRVIAPVYVVVTNSNHVRLTGDKENQKMYRHHTRHPKGLKERTAREQRSRDSRILITEAVSGMLPKNNLRKERLRHLKVYPTEKHPHEAQLAIKNSTVNTTQA
jgi:large subunit ribosomal protein L13